MELLKSWGPSFGSNGSIKKWGPFGSNGSTSVTFTIVRSFITVFKTLIEVLVSFYGYWTSLSASRGSEFIWPKVVCWELIFILSSCTLWILWLGGSDCQSFSWKGWKMCAFPPFCGVLLSNFFIELNSMAQGPLVFQYSPFPTLIFSHP